MKSDIHRILELQKLLIVFGAIDRKVFTPLKGEELAASPDLAEFYYQLKDILVQSPQLFPE